MHKIYLLALLLTFSLGLRANNQVEFVYKNQNFVLYPARDNDEYGSLRSLVEWELLKGGYDFPGFMAQEGDIMVDIGAHVGMVSIPYAKLHPKLTIYAFEANPDAYAALLKNIEVNNAWNIKAYNLAVTGDGQEVDFVLNPFGSALSMLERVDSIPAQFARKKIKSITLDQIFKQNKINRCKLLKIDCEGSEYEILYKASAEALSLIDNIIGEFHETSFVKSQGYTAEGLFDYMKNFVKGSMKIEAAFIDGNLFPPTVIQRIVWEHNFN